MSSDGLPLGRRRGKYRPSVLEATLVARAEASARSSPRIMRAERLKPPFDGSGHGRPGGWAPSRLRCSSPPLESIDETPLGSAEPLLNPTAGEHGDPDVCTSPRSRSRTPPARPDPRRGSGPRLSSRRLENPQRRDAAVEPAGGTGRTPRNGGACGTLRGVRRGPPAGPMGVHRRCDRAWVSRAFAASQIRPSSRSRAGLVGLEL